MPKQKLSELTIETWSIDSKYPDGTPDAKGTIMGVYAHSYDSSAKAVFSLLEKDGKVEAVVNYPPPKGGELVRLSVFPEGD